MTWSAHNGLPLRVLAGWWLTAIAASALVLPSLGPLLDHHFVERLPTHTHSFSGEANPAHVHSYEMPGHLDHSGVSPDALLEAGDAIYTARDGGAALAPGDVHTKLNPDGSVFPGLNGRDLLALLERGAGPLVGAFIPPPWTPPRFTTLSR